MVKEVGFLLPPCCLRAELVEVNSHELVHQSRIQVEDIGLLVRNDEGVELFLVLADEVQFRTDGVGQCRIRVSRQDILEVFLVTIASGVDTQPGAFCEMVESRDMTSHDGLALAMDELQELGQHQMRGENTAISHAVTGDENIRPTVAGIHETELDTEANGPLAGIELLFQGHTAFKPEATYEVFPVAIVFDGFAGRVVQSFDNGLDAFGLIAIDEGRGDRRDGAAETARAGDLGYLSGFGDRSGGERLGRVAGAVDGAAEGPGGSGATVRAGTDRGCVAGRCWRRGVGVGDRTAWDGEGGLMRTAAGGTRTAAGARTVGRVRGLCRRRWADRVGP